MDITRKISTEPQNIIESDCWAELRSYTDARIALGRTGASLPTDEYLKFSLSHAMARDAVHTPFERDLVREDLNMAGLETLYVESAAPNRSIYLTRPDLGRKLSKESHEMLKGLNSEGYDITLVIGDGLSSTAVHQQAVPLVKNLLPYLEQLNMTVAPIVLANQSRVALGDEVGELLKTKLVAILIGERPGLSSPNSLGVYMTWSPNTSRLESERNCISNIRLEGLTHDKAAFKLAWLIENAFATHSSGVALKDMSDDSSRHKIVTPNYDDKYIGEF